MTRHTRPQPLNLKTYLPDGVLISTVRLPATYDGDWYETMIFVAGKGGSQQRYETKAEAETGHAALVAQWTAKQGALPE